jgi:adenine-specific DNA-methyltransferase
MKTDKYSKLTKEELIKLIERMESRKKYGLIWDEERIKEKFEKDAKSALPVLKEIKSKKIEKNEELPVNTLIEGDNYHSLSVLNFTHQEKIDVIYIDPPYNTGNEDFKYNDNYVDKEDSFRHSKWLSFISKRLKLARNLLTDDGVIFISIGEDELAQLKLLCNEIFGEKNFITTFIWEKTQHFGRQKINSYSNADYILCYGKRLIDLKYKELLVEKIKEEHEDAPLYNASNPINELTIPPNKVIFNIPDGEYKKTNDAKYELISKVIVKKGKNKNNLVLKFKSRWSQRKVEEELQKGTTFWVKSEKFSIRAIYGNGKTSNESPKQILFTNSKNEFCAKSKHGQKVGVNEEASNELFNIIGEQNVFDYPKPKSLIEYLISLFFDYNKGEHPTDITVLDFFAGSGTTGHAVLSLNSKDNGKRTFILCTDDEANICSEICYPRISKVINGYKNKAGNQVEGLKGSLKYYKTSFVKNSISRDEMKIKITKQCTEMLCLREGIFNEIKNLKSYKIFKQDNKVLAIYYALDKSDLNNLKKSLDKIEGEKTLYCFTFNYLGLDRDDFIGWDDVRLEPIPQKILDIYKDIYEY